jgi:hypothetical protein
MSRSQWVAAGLFALGVAALIVAPQARTCMTSGDSTACETIGIIALNVAGVILLASGVIAFAVATARSRTR